MQQPLKYQLGKELLNLIRVDASILQISRWADKVYSDHCRELDSEMEDSLTRISFMQHGPEFEMQKAELKNIANKFIES